MSIIRCDRCSDPFDTDADVEGYNDEYDEWLCSNCRCAGCGSAKVRHLQDDPATLGATRACDECGNVE